MEPPVASFVIPVRNGAASLRRCLDAVLRQALSVSWDVIVVDDGSTDPSAEILAGYARDSRVRVIPGPQLGAAAALNTGVRATRGAYIFQVDQDVVVAEGWAQRLFDALSADDTLGAVQGHYTFERDGAVWARLMGLDLELRYRAISGDGIDQVCTGNCVYRREALERAGGFDEQLGYGYDNNLSYRLAALGYRLAFCRKARSVHLWRPTLLGYLRQQYGVGYGRLDVIRKHPRRIRGDDVSGAGMMLHAAAMSLCLVLLALTAWPASLLLLGVLAVERAIAAGAAWAATRDSAALAFVPGHLARDVAWSCAAAVWVGRRALGIVPHPRHSMGP